MATSTDSSIAFVAFDLGAESGRAMLATLADDRIELIEAHRFANLPQRLPSGYHWNLLDLWANLVEGLRQAGKIARERNLNIVSIGVDTWGVDFGLIGKSGQLLGLPFAYRDESHQPAMEHAVNKIGKEKLYDRTGIQFMPFNSLFQMVARHAAEPQVTEQAKQLLFMPDLLHYFFSGEMVIESTIASTSQMIDPRQADGGKWALDLFESLKLSTNMLGKIVPAGTKIGTLRQAVANDAGIPSGESIAVIVPGSHDTASAVAAVPVDVASNQSWAYLSSGTWSLMGAELDEPIINDESHAASFTNERGVENKIRFLKNISGLWLVQQVRRDLQRQGQTLDYATLTQQAAESEPFRTLVDPDYGPFASPGHMMQKLADFAKKTNQPVPETPGQAVRCCLETLALTYRSVGILLEKLRQQKTDVLHIVGGGGQNQLLNQMTADALGIPVIVGPYEATAIGNALTQAIGAGYVRDLAHLRAIVRRSFELKTFTPQNIDAYNAQYARFESLLGQ